MFAVNSRVATEHVTCGGGTVDLVTKHLDDPACVVSAGDCGFGTRRCVGFYAWVDFKCQVYVHQSGVDTLVFREFQNSFVASRHGENK